MSLLNHKVICSRGDSRRPFQHLMLSSCHYRDDNLKVTFSELELKFVGSQLKQSHGRGQFSVHPKLFFSSRHPNSKNPIWDTFQIIPVTSPHFNCRSANRDSSLHRRGLWKPNFSQTLIVWALTVIWRSNKQEQPGWRLFNERQAVTLINYVFIFLNHIIKGATCRSFHVLIAFFIGKSW